MSAHTFKSGDMVWCKHMKHLKDSKVKGMVLECVGKDKVRVEIVVPLSKEERNNIWTSKEILSVNDVVPFYLE